MKILRAEKFRPKKRNIKQQETKLRKTDWDVIMQHDRFSGKLNLRCEAALKDPASIKRLLEAEMIDPKGYITSEGRKKCAALSQKAKKPEPAGDAAPEVLQVEKPIGLEERQVEKMTASDWAVLMKYDRISGNLLKYNPETGELDRTSRAVLKDPAIIQRLIDNNMILPGGWLTPEAKLECDRIEKKLKNQAADDYTGLKDHHERLLKDEHQSKDKPNSKDKPEAKGDPEVYPEQQSKGIYPEQMSRDLPQKPELKTLSDKLSRIYADRKNDCDPGNLLADKSEAAAGEVSQTHTIRQHYPEPKDGPGDNVGFLSKGDLQPKDGPKTTGLSEQMLKPGAEDKKIAGRDLQAFFENLAYDNPESMPKDINLPNPAMKQGAPRGNSAFPSEDQQPAKLLPAHLQQNEPGEPTMPSKTAVIPLKVAASGETARPTGLRLRAVSKSEDQPEEKPKRRKRHSGGGGGDITAPISFSLRDIFHVIFKHKVLILISFAIVVTAVIIGTYLTKPTYEASAKILVKMGRESVFIPATGNVNPIINYNSEEHINSEIEILKSPSLAEKVVSVLGPTALYEDLKDNELEFVHRIKSRIGLKKEKQLTSEERAELKLKIAARNLQKNLNIEAIQRSNIIQLRFQHQDPNMAALVVNKLSDAYFDQHLQVHKTPQSHQFFQEQSELLKNKLEQSEQQLETLKKQHNITSLEQERTLLLEQTSALRAELNTTSSQIVETEKRIYQLLQQLGSTQKTIPQAEETNQNQQLVSTLQARLVELELKEKELMAKYTDQSRLVKNVKDEIRVVKEKLADPENKSFGTTKFGVNPTYQKLQENLLSNEANLKALKAKAETQKSQLGVYQDKLEEFNRINVELNQLQQQIDVNRQNYRLYLSKFEESRISSAMDTEKIASVSLIEPARPPLKPVKPKKMLNLVIAIFLGTFGGLGLAFFREYLDDKIDKIEDVETQLQLPVLASIPIFEQKSAAASKA